MKAAKTLLLIYTLAPLFCTAQISNHMDSIRVNGKTKATPAYLWQGVSIESVLSQIVPYTTDSISAIADEAMNIAYLAGINSSNAIYRQLSAKVVAMGLFRDNRTISNTISRLKSYSATDINDETKNIIEDKLKDWKSGYYNGIALMAAQLGVGKFQIMDRLNTDRNATTELKWDLHLALARLGEQKDIDYVVRKAKSIPMDYIEEIMHSIVPQLIYTRSKDATDICVEMLQDNRCKCSSPNPTIDKKILCGYRIMEMLAPAIKDFPYKVDKSGSLDTDDYEEALAVIRQWFLDNPDYQTID